MGKGHLRHFEYWNSFLLQVESYYLPTFMSDLDTVSLCEKCDQEMSKLCDKLSPKKQVNKVDKKRIPWFDSSVLTREKWLERKTLNG